MGNAHGRLAAGLIALAVAACLTAPVTATAAPLRGVLDRSFGHRGRALSSLPPAFASSSFSAIARQADGKLLIAGIVDGRDGRWEGIVQRRDALGNLDPSFGDGGRVVVVRESSVSALAAQADGGVVVGIQEEESLCGSRSTLRRLHPDGARDRSFGKDGRSAPLPLAAELIAVDAQGRLLVAGLGRYGPCTKSGVLPAEVRIARLLPGGALDTSFGNGGFVGTDSFGDLEDSYATGLGVAEDGTILVSGNRSLLRLSSQGALETSFGGDGVVELADRPKALLVLPGGGALVASGASGFARSCCVEPGDFAVSRYRSDGQLEPSFGEGGRARLDVGEVDEATALALSPDGGIVVAGASAAADSCGGGECRFVPVLLRFTSGGAPDANFGAGAGWTTVELPGEAPSFGYGPPLTGLATDPGGRIYLTGDRGFLGDAFVLARDPGGRPDPSFGRGGLVEEVRRLPSNTEASELAIGPRGEVFVAGFSDTGRHGGERVVMGLEPDGRPNRRLGSGAGFVAIDAENGLAPARGGRFYAVRGRHVVRFGRSGRRDPGYGAGGAAALPERFAVAALRARSGGRLLVVGRDTRRGGMLAFQLTASGRPDRRFGRRGVAYVGFGRDVRAKALAVAIDSRRRVLLLGNVGTWTGVVRLLPDGRLDRRFGRRGVRRFPFADPEQTAIGVQPDGEILVAGTEYTTERLTALVRLRPDGSLDRSFGRRGVVRSQRGVVLAILAGRRQIVLVAGRGVFGEAGVALRSYRPSGAVDRRFGRHGVALDGRARRRFRPVAAARQPSGRIVVAGTVGYLGEPGADVALLRFR